MIQHQLQTKKKGLISDDFTSLMINGIDGIIILFFVTTGLFSAGATQSILSMTALTVLILIALIMGISAFIAARQEKNHFYSLENEEMQEAEDLKEQRLLKNLGINVEVQKLAQEEIDKDRKNWTNLMQQLNGDQNTTGQINPSRNAIITCLSYIIGGIIPLSAYFFTLNTLLAFRYSSMISLTILFILGFFKSSYLKRPLIDGAMISLFTGAFAGIAGYFIAKLFIRII